ncbi:DUF1223 domain-containing protein [Rhodopirellula sp. SWK7]|uniref:DUF1223 domain-containing protein n=1 Tax=Rhodopirellula sp. SWK7 TaxID=595460 RepID=UPI0002BFFA99|nr:DUF1223 domain-containing protein [Rhodopirellula sp. SWK7]EMI46858.1 secreted protein containing DUF1223 [Rhodopirellula sp. SWK7]
MRVIPFCIVCFCAGCWGVVLPSPQSFSQTALTKSTDETDGKPANNASPSGIAVVELFTSQGCSSCPSADRVLQRIDSVADEGKLRVYALSFHVDYWNRLGWEDPYSSPVSTRRQKQYAVSMQSNRIYTPQMIVNGTEQFLGSDHAQAHRAVVDALAEEPTSYVTLQVASQANDRNLQVKYQLTGQLDGCLLQVAAIQTPKANAIPRGENAGRTLTHVNVVRAFESVPTTASTGTVELSLPDDVEPSTTRVIAYVQNPKTLAITGANTTN